MKHMYKSILTGFAVAFAAAMLAVGCDRPYELDLPLAVTTRDVQLKSAGGSTHVLVYSTGHWTAHLTENVDWASLDRLEGNGNYELVFAYSDNYGVARKVGIALETAEAKDTVFMTQAGTMSEVQFNPAKTTVTILKKASKVTIPVSSDLMYGLSAVKSEVSYEDSLSTPWISNVSVSIDGISFDADENYSGDYRTAYIDLVLKDEKGGSNIFSTTVTVIQADNEPVLSLVEKDVTVGGAATPVEVFSFQNTIWLSKEYLTITVDGVEEEDPWLYNVKLGGDALTFNVKTNEGETPRNASINIAYDDGDETINETVKVTQSPAPKALDYAVVRAMTPGTLSSDGFIEGYIISDRTSLNVCTNTQIAQFNFDYEENDRTAYIESTDGKYGFCLKFKTVGDNKLDRYERVKIALNGLELVKQSNPDRYTLTGVTVDNILEEKTPDMFKIPAKKMTITELSDDDIFTLVQITGVEILCKDGCYTNCTDGYSIICDANPTSGSSTAPRWDVAPLMMSDAQGNYINMLTNSKVLWRRDGKDLAFNTVVPQGSGTFKGIVVSDELVRYGDVGRYQLRAMEEADIDLNGPAFSKTIVEWNWNNRKADLVPEIGTGTITEAGTVAAGADFNNTYNGRANDGGNGGATTNQKGLVSNGGIKLTKQWWNNTTNKGEHFDIHFSTAGISGSNMVFGIAWWHGSMGNTTLDSPAHWNLLYSVDGGTTFKTVEGGMLTNRSVVWWTTTSQDSCPGPKEFLRKLPAECFGKSEVILRLEVADKVADAVPGTAAATWQTNLGIEKGTIGTTQKNGQEIRIGTITVRYN